MSCACPPILSIPDEPAVADTSAAETPVLKNRKRGNIVSSNVKKNITNTNPKLMLQMYWVHGQPRLSDMTPPVIRPMLQNSFVSYRLSLTLHQKTGSVITDLHRSKLLAKQVETK